MSTNNQKRIDPNKKSVDGDNKNVNYKNLITQYYDRDPQLNDIHD